MEKMSDFFHNIKERMSNPLISSFVISWLIINWRIPIGLIFYSNDKLFNDGYSSYFDLISKNSSVSNYLLYPLFLALLYTFIFSVLRNFISAFMTWVKTWGVSWNLSIARKGKVATERYIQLREKYLNLINKFEELLEQETLFIQKNAELKERNAILTSDLSASKVDLSYWRDMNDVRVLGGLWDYEFRASITSEVKKYRVEIKSSQFFLYEDIAKQNLVETYNIQEFLCNPHTCEIYFRLVPNSSGNTHVQQFLRFPNSITELVGLENTKNHVLYKKVKDYK